MDELFAGKRRKAKWGKIGAPGSRKRKAHMAKIGRKGGKSKRRKKR